MARITVPAADDLLDVDLPIYRGQGFVRLVDYMGGDARIVQSARVSYGAGAKTHREDAGLIDHLIRHAHTSPLEKVRFEFLVTGVSMPIATQWIRHRMGSFNFVSYRYSEIPQDSAFQTFTCDDIRNQSTVNKQMSDGAAEINAALQFTNDLDDVQAIAQRVYKQAVDSGIAREQARLVLPQTLQTSFYWTIDLHNAFHFLRLRLAPDAQAEIREPAARIAECIKAVAPMAYDSFERHILNGARLSQDEKQWLTDMLGDAQGWQESARDKFGERKAKELIDKLSV